MACQGQGRGYLKEPVDRPNIPNSSFGPRLTRFRQVRGLTVDDLSRLAGLSVDAIEKLETGRSRRPAPSTVGHLAAAFGVSRAEILGLSEVPHYDTEGQAEAAAVADMAGLVVERHRYGLRITPARVHDRSIVDTRW